MQSAALAIFARNSTNVAHNAHFHVPLRWADLTDFGVSGALADPTLELHDGNGAIISQNDKWKSTQQAAIQNSGYAPPRDAEAAILTTLQRGNYTAVVRGKNNTTGIALVEVYNLDAN